MNERQDTWRRYFLPAGVHSMTVKPAYRNQGASWRMSHPLIYGNIDGLWTVWDRNSGEVLCAYRVVRNNFGTIMNERLAEKMSEPFDYYGFNSFALDAVA